MNDTNLNFAKIVANPTTFGWSQVYSAGKLFAAISLSKESEDQEKDYLNILGKEILNNLEQEFFTLETKDLESIRAAVLTTSEKIPTDVTLSFVIGVVSGDILYLYILGNGKVDIKRAGSLGTLLQAVDQASNSLKEASGYLQDKDVIILQTKDFSEVISDTTLSEFLENPSITESAENLAPLIHEKENPTASGILVEYKTPVKNDLLEAVEEPEAQTDQPQAVEESKNEYLQNQDSYETYQNTQTKGNLVATVMSPIGNFFGGLKNLNPKGLNNTRKIILLVVVLIIIIFAGSIFFALQKQDSQKITTEFNNIYPKAEKKYEEGQSLVDLNQALANDSFKQSKDILESGINDFAKDSTQAKQINALLVKVNDALGSAPKVTSANATEAKSSESFYLSTEFKNPALDFTKDTKNVYLIDSKAISSIANGQSTANTLVKNGSDWKTVGGLATYNTNMYVLDKDSNQVLKFLNNGSAYTKSDYLAASVKADFSKAVSITIDNNIYVLYSDGSIDKYFKGNSVDFALKGLDKALLNPIKIYSTPDFDNIYILDKGNSRIVVVDKTGAYKAQYSSPIIKNAKDFEVLESDKKIYVLSGGKIYKLTL